MARPKEPIVIIVLRADDVSELEFKKVRGTSNLWERTDKPLKTFIREGCLEWKGKIYKLKLTESGV